MNPKLIIFHGSRHYFRQFSNKYHFSGYGKMNFGWGVYFTPNINTAIYVCGGHDAFNYLWEIDGKRFFNNFINDSYIYKMDTDALVENVTVTYDRLHDFNWKPNFLNVLESGINLENYAIPDFEKEKTQKYYEFILQRMKRAKEVKIKPVQPFYLYQVEITPRRIFSDSKEITDKQRKLFNQQLKREKRKFSIPSPIDWHPHDHGFYSYLERKFMNRYKFSANRWEANRLTSLFLYRAGFDLMHIPNRDEYVLFDISKANIVGIEKVG